MPRSLFPLEIKMGVSENSAPVRPSRVFILPPPLYFGLAFGAGMLLQHAFPLPLADFPARWLLGVFIFATGIVCGPALAAFFLARRTTLNPFASPTLLFDRGIYRLSRNPMYLGVILIYLGGCLLTGSLWPILLLVIPFGILQQIVIPYEEASMRRTFGLAYDAYCARVRRWL